MSMTPLQIQEKIDASKKIDDKYRKADVTQKVETLKMFLSFLDVASQVLRFAGFVILNMVIFRCAGNVFDNRRIERFTFVHFEFLGLWILREKIKARESVAGISGMTLIMYAFVFALRAVIPLMMYFDGINQEPMPCEVTVGIFSWLLVLGILKDVFLTHKSTYQVDLDTLKAWYLIPACFVMMIAVRPNFTFWAWHYDAIWAFNMYMDTFALMPQVVMMSRGGGKIDAPIANFVAATCIAHIGDIFNSLKYDGDVLEVCPFGFVLGVSSQFVHLLLVADFLYYYFKQKYWGSKFTDEMKLPKEAFIV